MTTGTIPSIVRNDGGLYEGDLKHYFRAVFNHATNLNNPYHNFRHMTHVLWLCYQACVFYSGGLLKRDMRNLLIAALFHDFDHTGSAGSDVINITLAVSGLRRHIAPEDDGEHERIAEIIKATEYPHVVPPERVGLLSRIIRDADLSQALSVAWIQQVVFGLATEWGRAPLDVLRDQVSFQKKLLFHTEWAQQMFSRLAVDTKVAEVQELVEILDVSV